MSALEAGDTPSQLRTASLTSSRRHISAKITMKPDGDPNKAMVIDKVEGGKFVYVTTINP